MVAVKFFDRNFFITMISQELFESLKSDRRKYPNVPFDILERFMSADGSGTYKFVEKMCQSFAEGYNMFSVISIMEEYQKHEVYLDGKGITHKTFDDVLHDIEDGKLHKLNSAQQRRNRERNSGLIYEDETFVFVLSTHLMMQREHQRNFLVYRTKRRQVHFLS